VGDLSLPLFAFVIAMTVLVRGVEHAWLAQLTITVPEGTLPMIGGAVAAGAIGSNIVNNIPMTVLARSVLESLPEAQQPILAYATLVGVNIGPALTTYGSLATMLWLTLVRKRGIDVTTRHYLRISLLTVPIVLLTTTITLWVVLR
jgi:arsenical pump membrane protein